MFIGTNPSWLDAVPGAITRIMTAQDLTKALDETAQAGPATKKPRHEGGGAAGGE